MQTLRVWEEKRGLTVAPLGSAQVTSPKVHGTLGPPTSHCPRGRSGSYTEPGAPGKKSGGTGLCVLQLFPVSYIVGIVSQAGKPSLLPHWPTDFQVSTLRCCKRQCVIRLIHHPRAGHQRGLTCYIQALRHPLPGHGMTNTPLSSQLEGSRQTGYTSKVVLVCPQLECSTPACQKY